MSIKIAYIEIDTHAEIAEKFRNLMMDSTIFKVDYYFSDKIFKQLNLKQTANIFLVDSKNLVNKISKNQDYDFVIIGTAHRYFNTFLKISSLYKTSIIVHNLNFVQLSSKQLFLNIFKNETIYRLKLLFREGLLLKNKLYRNAHNLFVLDEGLKNCNHGFQFLPIFYSKKFDDESIDDISIVIAGAVSQKRRDYKFVLKELENFANSKSLAHSKIEIVFLGKAENEELKWLINFENNNFENVKIIYFKEKIPQTDFDFYMQKATYLWCPLQKSTEFFSNVELYNVTKMSGIIGDAIKFKKLAFLPKEFSNTHAFIFPDAENLENQIQSFLNLKPKNYFAKFEKSQVLKNLEITLEKFI